MNGFSLYSVIENKSSVSTFIWKHYDTEFNTGSVLVVKENEEALFVKDGIVVQTFVAGKYRLETSNYPFISDLQSKFSKNRKQFTCSIYFVSKVLSEEILWGTNPPMQIEDKKYGSITLGANGIYKFRVINSKKFYLKVADSSINELTPVTISRLFQNMIISKIKENIAKFLVDKNISFIQLTTSYDELSANILPLLKAAFNNFGLEICEFVISGVSVPESDPSYELIKMAIAREKRGNEIYGKDYYKFTQEALLENVSKQDGASFAGLGVGIMASDSFASMGKEVLKKSYSTCLRCGTDNRSDANFCCNCGNPLQKDVFCTNCGNKVDQNSLFCSNCGQKL